ncbi:hypothetical protein KMZ68_13840 [Bradyrhizobium sediminis]|uniref:Uncharacterized protein n=1 Tax=Bradyrhizobium sediminis TaxID=2840469 RepID=A0A975RQX8_9BRAD|nr:hypothetical protein [Bradyrhizobium sediminis]QWG16126.1 hypothetical protein KMZ68_13840 [Bradyrhizobium sediminis]
MSDKDDTDSAPSKSVAPRSHTDVDAIIAEGRAQQGGDFDAWKVGRSLGMSDQKIRMGIGLLTGMNATAAAKAAGYLGEGNALRSAASKTARSKGMQSFLKAAADHRAGKPDAPLTDAEKLKELARLARSNNPQMQVRAIEAHTQLQEDMGMREKAPVDHDPVNTLREIAALSPLCAVVADELARIHGINFSSAQTLAMPSAEAKQQDAVIPIKAHSLNGAASGDARGVGQ